MIITQSRERRTFIGSLNRGAEIVTSVRKLTVDNAILCGLFSGSGYLENPTLRTYNRAKREYNASQTFEGAFHLVSLQGNISLSGTDTVIRVHVVGALIPEEGEPELMVAELLHGPVLSFEFTMSSMDDLRLYRAKDEKTGLDPWLHMDLGKGPPRVPEIVIPEPDDTPEIEDDDEQEDISVKLGDWLHHPTLGQCKVVQSDTEDRVAIELSSGRTVEIHLNLLDLKSIGPADDGHPAYQVAIRRRRR